MLLCTLFKFDFLIFHSTEFQRIGVVKFSLDATRSVLLQFWWEYLLLVGFRDGEYYVLKSPPNAGLRLD